MTTHRCNNTDLAWKKGPLVWGKASHKALHKGGGTGQWAGSVPLSRSLPFRRGPHTQGHLVTFKLFGLLHSVIRHWSFCIHSALSKSFLFLWLIHLQPFSLIISRLLILPQKANQWSQHNGLAPRLPALHFARQSLRPYFCAISVAEQLLLAGWERLACV